MFGLTIVLTITGTDIFFFVIGILNLVIGIYLRRRSMVIPYDSTRTNYFADKTTFTSSVFENLFNNSSENEWAYDTIPKSGMDILDHSLNGLNPYSRRNSGLSRTENHFHVAGDMNTNIQVGSPNSSQELSSSNIGIDPKHALNLIKSQLKDLGLNNEDELHVKSEIDSVKTLLEIPNPDNTEIYTKLERIKQVIRAGAKTVSAVSTMVSLIQMIQLSLGT